MHFETMFEIARKKKHHHSRNRDHQRFLRSLLENQEILDQKARKMTRTVQCEGKEVGGSDYSGGEDMSILAPTAIGVDLLWTIEFSSFTN